MTQEMTGQFVFGVWTTPSELSPSLYHSADKIKTSFLLYSESEKDFICLSFHQFIMIKRISKGSWCIAVRERVMERTQNASNSRERESLYGIVCSTIMMERMHVSLQCAKRWIQRMVSRYNVCRMVEIGGKAVSFKCWCKTAIYGLQRWWRGSTQSSTGKATAKSSETAPSERFENSRIRLHQMYLWLWTTSEWFS